MGRAARQSSYWLAALVGLNAAVAAAIAVKTRPWIMPDTGRYLRLAAAIRHGVYALPTPAGLQPEGWRQPGYPAFLALVQSFGGGDTAIVAAQAVLLVLVLALLARLVARRLGPRTAAAFLALCAVYPFLAYGTVMLASDSLALLLVVGGTAAVAWETGVGAAAAGLLLGAAGLVRPNLILLPFVLAAAIAVWGQRPRHLRRAAAVAIVAVLALFPWAVRNQRAFGHFSPMPAIAGSGAPLFLATWAGRMSHRDFLAYTIDQTLTPAARATGFAAQVEAVNAAASAPGANITTLEFYPTNAQKLAADRAMRSLGIANLKAHPWIYLEHSALNAVRAWVPFDALTGAVPAVHNRTLRWALLAASLGGFALALAGLAVAGSSPPLRREPLLAYAALVLLYFTGTLCWFDTEPRYTGPARALMLLFAAVALARLRPAPLARAARG